MSSSINHFYILKVCVTDPSPPTGEHGGSELHATWVRDRVVEEVKRRYSHLSEEDSTMLVKNCMINYRRHVRKSIDGKPFRLSGTVEDPEAASRAGFKRGVKRKYGRYAKNKIERI